MKWKTKILSLLCALLVMGACAPSRPSVDPASILIVYYSHTGHTQEAAGEIRDRTGGTLAQITRQQPYEDLYTQASVSDQGLSISRNDVSDAQGTVSEWLSGLEASL